MRWTEYAMCKTTSTDARTSPTSLSFLTSTHTRRADAMAGTNSNKSPKNECRRSRPIMSSQLLHLGCVDKLITPHPSPWRILTRLRISYQRPRQRAQRQRPGQLERGTSRSGRWKRNTWTSSWPARKRNLRMLQLCSLPSHRVQRPLLRLGSPAERRGERRRSRNTASARLEEMTDGQ